MNLKGDEVCLILLDIVFQFLSRVFPAERVGIVAIGQEQHLDVHPLCQQHIGTTHGSMDTRLVAVV